MIYMCLLMLCLLAGSGWAQVTGSPLKADAVAIPGGSKGVRLDDLRFAPGLHKVLAAAGQTGKLFMIDPVNSALTSFGGFTSATEDKKGHHVGVTSADEGEGFIFTGDHGARALDAVDEKSGKIAASIPLAGDPDIIRYAGATHEVWVTEPDDKNQIEVFSFMSGNKPVLGRLTAIPVSDGPESLTIDNAHGKAYTNVGEAVGVFDLKTHTPVVAGWPNTCAKPRGTALDEAHQILFVACGEGKAVSFDLNQGGKLISSILTGAGPDLIDYNPGLAHLYITGSKNGTLSVLAVSPNGTLTLLGTGRAAMRAHCVVGDDQDNIWVCDPVHGQLLHYKDTFPKS